MTPVEQQELLLRYFAVLLDGMSAADVSALRARLLQRFPAGEEQDTLSELIDGHLALRRLTE
jgi:hypothetical protein